MYVLDSSSVIEIIAGTEKGKEIINVTKGHPVFITSFTIFEVGRGLKEMNIEDILANANVLDFDKDASLLSLRIENNLAKIGKKIGYIDLFIAAICIANNKVLVTLDKDFSVIKELKMKML